MKRALPIGVLAGVALIAGCSTASDAGPETGLYPDVRSEPDVGFFQAGVGGTLGVNAAGCVVLYGRNRQAGALLSAPFGSSIAADGGGVELEGIGSYRFGEQVRGGGRTSETPNDRCGTVETVKLQTPH